MAHSSFVEFLGIYFLRLFKRKHCVTLLLGVLAVGMMELLIAAYEPAPQAAWALSGPLRTPLPTSVAAPTSTSTSTPSADLIGVMQWELRDTQVDQVLGRGTLEIHPGDVVVTRHTAYDGDVFYTKDIMIDETEFYLGYFADPEDTPSKMTGFGMYLNRTDMDTFSWEWFTVANTHQAIKLQGAGDLEFGGDVIDGVWDMTHLEFQTDVVFRCQVMEGKGAASDLPRWTLTIFAGSYIDWPHFVSESEVTPSPTPGS